MIGLDTNVLIRLFIEDDPEQTRRARYAVKEAAAGGRVVFINSVVLVEFVWVMESVFGKQRSEIAACLEMIVDNNALSVESERQVKEAVFLYRDHKYDFADLLIGLVNKKAGCAATWTFDRKAARMPYFQLLT